MAAFNIIFQNCVVFILSLTVVITTSASIENPNNCLNDKHRPQFHFSPAKNWINDPNGLIYLDGEYHLFYQYNPDDTVWGPMHWGHAISTDLVHWEEYPIAMYPDHLGTIYSGSAVIDYQNKSGLQTGPTLPIIAIFTHSGSSQQQSIAVSNDKGRNFEKYEGNPVITNPGVQDFRDPKVIQVDEGWVMSLAVGDKISFYTSNDLKSWTSTSEFGANPPEGAHGGVWECPDFFPITVNNEIIWVLLVSLMPGGPNLGSATQYFLGTFDGKIFKKFDNNEILWMDWGPDNYAGVTFSNEPNNRKILIGWMNNLMYGGNLPTALWRGQMTIPRVLNLKTIDGKIRLTSTPVQELEILRNPLQYYQRSSPLIISNGAIYDLSSEMSFKKSLLEVDLTFNINLVVEDPSTYFRVCFSNLIKEEICQGYNYGTNEIFLDRQNSGNTGFNPDFGRRASAKRETENKTLQVKLYLDTSTIEIFADNGFTMLTGLFYPEIPLSGINIEFNSQYNENQLVLQSATIHGLNSIYNC